MNDTVVLDTKVPSEVAEKVTMANTTQVVGEIAIIAAALWAGHKLYRMAVNRSVRKALKEVK